MSNSYSNVNPQQLNPAVLQALQQVSKQNQQSVPLTAQIGTNTNFLHMHQTYQRLQSQESAKIDQQRLGIGLPGGGQQHHQQPQHQQQPPQAPHSQVGMQNQHGAQHAYNMANMSGMNLANMANMANMANFDNMGNLGAGTSQNVTNGMGIAMPMGGVGVNLHSQQQGLNLTGVGESEQGRRQMLQNMLSQQLQSISQPQDMHQTPNMQQSSNMQQLSHPQIEQSHAQGQSMPPSLPGQQQTGQSRPPYQSHLQRANLPPVIIDFIRNNPAIFQTAMNRHGGDHQPAFRDIITAYQQNQAAQTQLNQHRVAAQAMASSAQQSHQQQIQTQQQLQIQQQQQHLQQQQLQQQPPAKPPHVVGLNGGMSQQGFPQQPRQLLTVPPHQGGHHSRAPSSSTFDMQQVVQGQLAGMGNFDAKQLEALQLMKERQQRQGLVTPQTQANSLPLVSPQPLSLQNSQLTSQLPSQPLRQSSQSQQVGPMQVGGMAPPPPGPQRQPSQSNLAQQAHQPKSIREAIMRMTDVQLHKSGSSIAQRLNSSTDNQNPNLAHLLMVISDVKRRKLNIPQVLHDAAARTGGPNFADTVLAMEWQPLADFAQQSLDSLRAQHLASQQGQPQAGNMAGSQGNPIEVVTPIMSATPQLPSATGLPNSYVTPALQTQGQPVKVEQKQSWHHPVRAPQQQHQTSNESWQTPAQLLAQTMPATPGAPVAKGQAGNLQAQPKPWAGEDFRIESIPFDEDGFWRHLGQQHMQKDERLPPPLIEGKPVDLMALFSIVHKNGGSQRIGSNIQPWASLAGMVHLGSAPDRNRPQIATLAVGQRVKDLYLQYLQSLEDSFYSRLWAARQDMRQRQAQQPVTLVPAQLNPVVPQPYIANQGPIMSAQFPSAQFLDALALAPTGPFTDHQRRIIDDVRRGSQSSTPPQFPTNYQNGPPATSPALAGPSGSSALSGQTPGLGSGSGNSTVQAFRSNPGLVFRWIRQREDTIKAKFPKESKILTDIERQQFVAQIRQLVPSAKEAQQKIARFIVLLADQAGGDLRQVEALIPLYMFTILCLAAADRGSFPLHVNELARIRIPLEQTLKDLNARSGHIASTSEGQSHLQRLFAGIDAYAASQAPAQSGPPLPPHVATASVPFSQINPTVPPAMEESITARLPKGLRVEDLKQPPSKRQKGAKQAVESPLSQPVRTPETAKTPNLIVVEPPLVTTGGKKATPSSNKRKRQSSAAIVSKAAGKSSVPLVVEVKEVKPIPRSATRPAPAQGNALGINIDAADAAIQAEIAANAPFFAAQQAIRDLSSAEGVDLWGTLASAVEEWKATLPPVAGPSTETGNSALDLADDDLFAQWVDISQMEDAPQGYPELTPELIRVASLEAESSELSPESIRTVASLAGSLKTPAIPQVGLAPSGTVANPALLGGPKETMVAATKPVPGYSGPEGSPGSQAFNGFGFVGWDDDDGFGLQN